MEIFYRITIFLVCGIIGLYFLVKTLSWVDLVGRSNWAESHLGGGGTYTMWKLVGIIVIIVGILILAGTIPIGR